MRIHMEINDGPLTTCEKTCAPIITNEKRCMSIYLLIGIIIIIIIILVASL